MRKFFKWKVYPVIFICLFLFIICNKDAPRAYRKIQIEKLFEIGSESGDDNYIFYNPSSIGVDSKGNIYVLDTGNARIQKFDPDGKYLATIGKKGEGPGELTGFVFAFFIDDQDVIWVADRGNLRISKFKSTGEYLNSFKVRYSPLNILVNKKREVILRIIDFSGLYSFVVLNEHGKELRKFGKLQPFDNRYLLVQMNYGSTALNEQDEIYHSFSSPYKIQKYDRSGKLIKEFTRVLPYKIFTPVVDTSKGYPQYKNYKRVSFAVSVFQGYIFNLFSSIPENTEAGDAIDIFDSSNRLVQTIFLDIPATTMIVKNNKLYILEIENFFKVGVYKINEGK